MNCSSEVVFDFTQNYGTFKEIQPNLTEVTFLYSFKLRFPFSMLKKMVKRNLESNVKQRLIDLKKSIEQNTQPASKTDEQ
jgi:UDP-galactopyranose mutase